MRPVDSGPGLTVGLVVHGQSRQDRRRAYYSDVLYACNKELVFDYLRDRHAIGRPSAARLRAARLGLPADNSQTLMRGLHFAIVDEADGILIDEARTPLIISREHEAEMSSPLCDALLEVARKLAPDTDYKVSEARRTVRLTPAGQAALPEMLGSLEGHWKAKRARDELIEQALAALWLYRRDQHYIVADQKISDCRRIYRQNHAGPAVAAWAPATDRGKGGLSHDGSSRDADTDHISTLFSALSLAVRYDRYGLGGCGRVPLRLRA